MTADDIPVRMEMDCRICGPNKSLKVVVYTHGDYIGGESIDICFACVDAMAQQRGLGVAGEKPRGEVIFDMLGALRFGDVVCFAEGLEQIERDPRFLFVDVAPQPLLDQIPEPAAAQ